MVTIDMNPCRMCQQKNECETRKRIIQALSPVANDLNMNEQPGDPVVTVIVACQR